MFCVERAAPALLDRYGVFVPPRISPMTSASGCSALIDSETNFGDEFCRQSFQHNRVARTYPRLAISLHWLGTRYQAFRGAKSEDASN